jgi:hypothetical protein
MIQRPNQTSAKVRSRLRARIRCNKPGTLQRCSTLARPALVTRHVNAFCRIFGDLVPQRPHGDAKQARRRGSVAMGISKRFQNQIPFDVSNGRADQPPSETAARRRGNRSVRRHASHCATPQCPPCPSSGDNKKVNDFLTRSIRHEDGSAVRLNVSKLNRRDNICPHDRRRLLVPKKPVSRTKITTQVLLT